MPIDFELLTSSIIEIETLIRHHNDNFCANLYRRTGKNDQQGSVQFTRDKETSVFLKSCIVPATMERDDLSNHEKIGKAAGEKRLFELAAVVLDQMASIPFFAHPRLSVAIRVFPRSDSHQIRAQISVDSHALHPAPLTLPSLVEKTSKLLDTISRITPSGPLEAWLVNDQTFYADSAAAAFLKYGILRKPSILEAEFESSDYAPRISKVAEHASYLPDLKSLIAKLQA